MDPQENGQNVITPAPGTPDSGTTPATPISTNPGATPAPGATTPADNGTVDLSAYMGDDGHTLDFNKVAELYKNAEKYKTSAAFFQTKYQQKNGVPDDVNEYMNTFKPDSSYAKFMENQDIKDSFNEFFAFAKEQGIGKDHAHAIMDWYMKDLVGENGILDNRSEAEKEADFAKAKAEFSEAIKPLLESTNRTQAEQNTIIENFLKSENIFTSNPKMKEYMLGLTNDPMGYMFVSMVTEMIDGSNVPVVSGTVSTKDLNAMRAELAKETDPVRREEMMKQFFGSK